MDLKIRHNCPSCGAPVEMQEAQRLTDCSFCDVQQYMVDNGLLRYVLPSKDTRRNATGDTYYFPYLRFKGNIFTCQGNQIDAKVLDTTHRGVNTSMLPASLGLRPQAMKVSLVDAKCSGSFIRRKETAVTVLQRAALLAKAALPHEEAPLYHRAFIGETVSCIYLPLVIENDMVYDGVLDRLIGSTEQLLSEAPVTVPFQEQWQPSFLATICPQCGDTMHGEADSLILHCFNCQSCWAEKGGKFVPVPYRLVPGTGADLAYLPFWRISVETKGIDMRTMADLLTITNQPVVVNNHHRSRSLEFWIPAIKIRPAAFLKMARSATLSQIKYPEGERKLARRLHPVTLPLKEGIQAVKSIIAEMTVRKKSVLPALPKLSIAVRQTSLVFLPFEDTGHDLVQIHSAIAIASSIVRFGRKL